MNKKSKLFMSIGLCLVIIGIIFGDFDNKEEENTFALRIMDDVTNIEKEQINEYLNNKYNDSFTVLKHVTTYCYSKDNTNYIDETCNNTDIINDIFLVKDKNDINFYVKEINVNVDNFSSAVIYNGFYDNYVIYLVKNKLEEELKGSLPNINNITGLSIIDGFGIDKPEYKMDKDKYIYYIIYNNLNYETYDILNKDISIEEYVNNIRYSSIYNNKLEINVNVNERLTKDNVQNIIKNIYENGLVSFKYGIEIKRANYIFNNNLMIICEDGYTFKIVDMDEDLMYGKTITIDFVSYSDNIINYEEFLKLDKSTFNF